MGTITLQEGYRQILGEPGLQQKLSGSQNVPEDAKRGSEYFDRKGVCTDQVTSTCPTPATISKARVISRQL
jgi:hypothetical protein